MDAKVPDDEDAGVPAVLAKEDCHPLLIDELEEQGVFVTVADDMLVGRCFAIIDGNHRHTAIEISEVTVPSVRSAIIRCDSALELISAGTLLNLVRGIQAADNFYDRVNWVRSHDGIYRASILAPEQAEWDKQNPNPTKTKLKSRPS